MSTLFSCMRIHFTKPSLILIAVATAILTLVLMVAAVSANTSTKVNADNCNCGCNTMNMQSSMPACCSVSGDSFPACDLSNLPHDEATLPSRSSLNWNINNCQHTQGIPTGIDNGLKRLREQELPQLSSPHLCSEFHCRNNLDSEDPYLN